MLILEAPCNYSPHPTCGNEIHMLLRAILCEVFGTDSFLARPRRKMFSVDFAAKGMVMVTYFGNFLLKDK